MTAGLRADLTHYELTKDAKNVSFVMYFLKKTAFNFLADRTATQRCASWLSGLVCRAKVVPACSWQASSYLSLQTLLL